MKLAAIDIGSNAVRLLIANVIESNPSPVFKKIAQKIKEINQVLILKQF